MVLFLRLVGWQVDGFTPERYDGALRALHERIRAEGGFETRAHRFHLVARREPAA